ADDFDLGWAIQETPADRVVRREVLLRHLLVDYRDFGSLLIIASIQAASGEQRHLHCVEEVFRDDIYQHVFAAHSLGGITRDRDRSAAPAAAQQWMARDCGRS